MTMGSDALYGRVWSVTIGPPGQAGKKWTDLDIEFSVEKTGSSTPNKIELTLYNLSATSRGFVEKRKQAVIIEAGYDGNSGVIASGETDIITHVHEGADWQTKITAADGLTAYQAPVHAAMGPGTTEIEVLRKLAHRLGLKLGSITGLSDRPFSHGRMLSGPARFELDAICRTRNLRWAIHDGALVVWPVGGATKPQTEAVLLSPSSGLIGSPEKTEKGWKLLSLLRHDLTPGDPIKVKSSDVDGIFAAEKVCHKGQSNGNDWYTEIQAVKL